MELKTITCPNCGATTTNPNNCEFCGSLLVRFADKGIDLSQTSYLNNEKVIPGLIPELKKNLMLQKTTDEIVVTDIYRRFTDDGERIRALEVVRSGYANWESEYDPVVQDLIRPILLNNSKHGLVIVVKFFGSEDTGKIDDDKSYKAFKALPSFHLFTQDLQVSENSERRTYAIDFGEDAEGAARLISEYLESSAEFLIEHDWSYVTNVGLINIDKSRRLIEIPETYEIVYGSSLQVSTPQNEPVYEEEEEDETDWGKVLRWTLYILGILIYMMIRF